MKSVFVLGLAVAASAQLDNELAQAYRPPSQTYNPSGADLVKNAGWGRHLPVGYKSLNRDDQADDELMVYYTKDSRGVKHYEGGYTRRDDEAENELHLSGADLVKYAKQSQQTVYRPTAHVVRDDEAENELHLSGADLVKYAKQSQQTVYRPTAHVVRDDEAAEDELMVYYTKDSRGVKHYEGGYTRRDDEAENELHLSGADLVKYAKQSQQTVYRPTAHVVRDDEAAEDELMVYYTKDSRGVNHYQGGYTRRDDAADDELAQTYYPPSKSSPGHPSGADLVKNAGWGRHLPIGYRSLNRDDQAEDELIVYMTVDGRGHKHYQAGYPRGGAYKPHFVRDDEAAEDELMVYYTKDSRGVKHYEGGYTRRDDAADDELVQTFYSPSGADLVKYAKQSQQTVYRPTAHVVRDDEVDDELAYLGLLIKETQNEKKPEIRRNFRHAEKN